VAGGSFGRDEPAAAESLRDSNNRLPAFSLFMIANRSVLSGIRLAKPAPGALV